jgi:hypothetical protein
MRPHVARTIVEACSNFNLDGMDEDTLDELIDIVSVAHLSLGEGQ